MKAKLPLAGLVLALAGLMWPATAPAMVSVGDKPTLRFKVFGTQGAGQTLDLAALRGKIVVVDFWATWCGPCMAEAPHMVQLNDKYAGPGFQFVGISLDDDPSALTKVIKAKGFTWPMSFEGGGWNGATPKAWGVNSIPQTFIIGPDGTVLWRGHPGNIDQPLADAFKEHPPILVDPKTMATATAALDQIDAAITTGDSAKAVKLLDSVPSAATADGKIAERVKSESAKLQALGVADLAKVDPLIEAKNYTEATAKLRELSQAYAGLPVVDQIKQKLNDLQADPNVKAQLEADRRDKDSTAALAEAKKYQANKQDELAYKKFKDISKIYSGTAAASEAADAVKTYEADTAFMAAVHSKANRGKAQALLAMAESYKAAGKIDMAKKKYQDVITQYPDSTWATTAKQAMDALNQ